ncbi:class F sortase [Agromyces sp. NPDC057865]|uniref:class F sortase n=1 Tax=Agromyces sp. NPDC057865 TaxID=3346267 RepID=UPI00366CDADD
MTGPRWTSAESGAEVASVAAAAAAPASRAGTSAGDLPDAVTDPLDVPRQSAALDAQGPAPASPTRLEVPSLGIDVSVQPVGLDEQGRMALIDDPAVAAWYQYGPAPASASGSTVIAAHVDSLTYDVLPFARLRDASPGMEIVVTDAAGAQHRYAVQGRGLVPKDDADWDGAFDRSGPARLTLVTCGGEFDYGARRYLSNLVLTATPTR